MTTPSPGPSRRDILAGLAAVAGPFPRFAPRARFQAGGVAWEPEPGWPCLPAGKELGWGAGVAADSRGRTYLLHRGRPAVLVFSPDGRCVARWGDEWAEGGHSLRIHRDGSGESLLITDHLRGQAARVDLQGRVLFRLGRVANGPRSRHFPLNQPTDAAIAPGGEILVAEGYGGSVVHLFSADGRHLRTLGTPGTGPGQFDCPHGISVEGLPDSPLLCVADRGNGRVQWLDLWGRPLWQTSLRLPCGFARRAGLLFVADLDGHVAALGPDRRVAARLGAGQGLAPPAFQAPHAVAVDPAGSLLVVEWTRPARLLRLTRVRPLSAALPEPL